MPANDQFVSDRFPRASKYHPDWVLAGVSGGANPLWLAEWLAERLELHPGMRVLDLGCGHALSSIFLHREFGVQVWATDLWCKASDNLRRIRDADVETEVFPIQADARALPFAAGFFDAIVSIDSIYYYGTDDLYLNYMARFLKPGGRIGIAGAGIMREMDDSVPAHLQEWWNQDLPWCLHSADWWGRHWRRTRIVDIEVADTMAEGWRMWLRWLRMVAPENATEIRTLEIDAGAYLSYVRVVARLRADAPLQEPILSAPTQYTRRPLLRD